MVIIKKKKRIVSIHLALFASLKLKTKTTRFIAGACSTGLIRFPGLARGLEDRFWRMDLLSDTLLLVKLQIKT